MIEVMLAAALAAASPEVSAEPAPSAPADAEPAMYVVRDADTTVYIFGTFHALDGRSDWFNDEVRNAFDASDQLVLETLVPEWPARHAMPQQSLHSAKVTPTASFLATTRMAINAGKSQGMQVALGADMVLRRAAEENGKAIEGLETLESQLTMFTRMPAPPAGSTDASPAQAQPGVAAGATPMTSLSTAMAQMQDAWNRGDHSIFVYMLGQLEQNSPATYRMLFTERNGRWADWVAGRMQTPGTVFVAVGAGHLAGKDSLLVRLAELGIESRRAN